MTSQSGSASPAANSSPSIDPWAPGGAMSTPDVDAGPDGQPAPTPTAAASPAPSGRRRRWAAVTIGAVLVASVVGVTSRIGSDETTASARPTPRRDVFPGESIPASPTDEAVTSQNVPIDRPGIGPPVIDVVALADQFRTIQPTEIVALSPSLGLVEISLPSGRIRTTDLPWAADTARLATTDFGALVWAADVVGVDQPAFTVIGDGQRPLPVIDATTIDHVSSTPGLDRFVVWPPDEVPPRQVTADGTIVGIEVDTSLGRSPMDPEGGLLVEGTGGVYRTGKSGTRRLSTGDLVATGRNHVLVHECDVIRTCRLVTLEGTLDRGGARRRASTFTTHDLGPDHPIWSATPDGVAPDGSAFLAVADGELAVVSFADGAITAIPGSATLDGAWASDSSGVFFTGATLEFFARDNASVTVVSDALPNLQMATSRRPRATPECELAELAAWRFDAIRAGEQVGVPSSRVFAGLQEFAPADLVASTDDLATFLAAFVSAERAGSQRIENWPANVRSGVAAIDGFVTANCS